MKRGLAMLAALVLLVSLMSGCGGGSDTASSTTVSEDMAATEEAAGSGSYGGNMMAQMPESAEGADGGEDRLQNAKMIYTADLTVETTAFDDAASSLRQMVEDMGGYFETASLYNRGGDYRSASYTIRVPADQFQNLLTQVGELCHVVRKEESGDNIGEEYYDVESRLVTQQTKLERLQTLLSQAETMEDIITIESAISETEYEIERLSGTMRHYDALVDYATVTLELNEVYRLSGTEDAPKSFGEKLSNAFTDGLAAVAEGLENFAIWLAYSWLGILIFAAVVFAAVKLIGRLRRGQKLPKIGRKKSKNTANETKVEE